MTDIHHLLTEIHDTIVVPSPNHADLQRRVTRIRRRRRLARTGAAVAGVAASAVAVAGLAMSLPWDKPSAEPSVAALPANPMGVAVILDGQVTLVDVDGDTVDTGVAGALLGAYRDRPVVLAGDQLVGLEDAPIASVRTAFVDSSGATFQREDGTLGAFGDHQVFYLTNCTSCHNSGSAGSPGAEVSMDGLLVAAGEEAYVVQDASGLSVIDAAGTHPIPLASDGVRAEVSSVQVGGDTVSVASNSTVQFFDTNGTRRSGFLGGVAGALSADGTTYAYAPTADELASGMKPGLSFYDTTTGKLRRTSLDGAVDSIAWRDGDLLVVTDQAAETTLWRCETSGCENLFDTRGESLTLRGSTALR